MLFDPVNTYVVSCRVYCRLSWLMISFRYIIPDRSHHDVHPLSFPAVEPTHFYRTHELYSSGSPTVLIISMFSILKLVSTAFPPQPSLLEHQSCGGHLIMYMKQYIIDIRIRLSSKEPEHYGSDMVVMKRIIRYSCENVMNCNGLLSI